MFKTIKHPVFSISYIQICMNSGLNKGSKVTTRMPGELTKETDITSKKELEELGSENDMKWRTPWHQKEGAYYHTLRNFYSEHNNTNVMKFLQSPINLSPSSIKEWWARKQKDKSIFMQQYIPERNQTLGNELAAAHFVVHRGGAVKFFGQDFWIKANEFNTYSLPNKFESDLYLQGIDCSDMELYYEGLVNMQDLQQVEWFSVNGSEEMDDWCMDKIANIFSKTLLYLDIRDCKNITHRGLGAIVKMNKLKILYVDDVLYSDEFEMTCLMLQQVLPHLDIRTE